MNTSTTYNTGKPYFLSEEQRAEVLILTATYPDDQQQGLPLLYHRLRRENDNHQAALDQAQNYTNRVHASYAC